MGTQPFKGNKTQYNNTIAENRDFYIRTHKTISHVLDIKNISPPFTI